MIGGELKYKCEACDWVPAYGYPHAEGLVFRHWRETGHTEFRAVIELIEGSGTGAIYRVLKKHKLV